MCIVVFHLFLNDQFIVKPTSHFSTFHSPSFGILAAFGSNWNVNDPPLFHGLPFIALASQQIHKKTLVLLFRFAITDIMEQHNDSNCAGAKLYLLDICG